MQHLQFATTLRHHAAHLPAPSCAAQARPLPVDRPFQVQPSEQPLTVPQNVVLYTEIRAEDREAFDAMAAERMQLQEVLSIPYLIYLVQE